MENMENMENNDFDPYENEEDFVYMMCNYEPKEYI